MPTAMWGMANRLGKETTWPFHRGVLTETGQLKGYSVCHPIRKSAQGPRAPPTGPL